MDYSLLLDTRFVLPVFIVLVLLIAIIEGAILKRKVKRLANGAIEMTPKEFLATRKQTRGNARRGQGLMKVYDFQGVYILFNQTKNMYYVGQGTKVMDRVNNHFTGKGNGDVYADYKYGDSFTIKLIPLEGSGFDTLNALERNTIEVYNAYSKGYNKTRGNKG